MFTVSNCSYNRNEPAESEFCIELPNGRESYTFYFFLTSVKVVVNNQTYNTSPNTLFITTPHTPYFIYADDDYYMSSYFRFQADSSDLSLLHIPLNKPTYIANTVSLQNYLYQICFKTHYTSNAIERLEVHSLCTLFFCNIHTQLNPNRADVPTPTPASSVHLDKFHLLNELRSEMFSNLFENWTIEQMAKRMNMSTKQFRHYYKKFFQCTPKEDLQFQRLNLAKMYLLTSSYSISEIAFFCGFQSLYYFTSFFTKNEGVSPSLYRKQHSTLIDSISFDKTINC